MSLECFSEDQIGKISHASFELGRLHAQEDLLTQYRRCKTFEGLSEIDFVTRKQEWTDELDAGIYKFTYRSVGGSYYLSIGKHQMCHEWVEDAVPDCMYAQIPEATIYVQAPETPISPPTQSTFQECELSQSVSVVSLKDYSGSDSESSSGYFPEDEVTITWQHKRASLPIIGGLWKKVKFEEQPPGAYPWGDLTPAGGESSRSLGASNFVQQKPGHSSGIAASFDWSVDQSDLPATYDRKIPKGSVMDDPEYARFLAIQGTRMSKVKPFVNPRMAGEEYKYWENWSGAKDHPFRSIPLEPGKSRTTLGLWPFYLVRTPQLSLYHMCRHSMGVTIPELIPIRIYSTEQRQNLVVWLPRSCGLGSPFHEVLKRTGHISIKSIAMACGFHQTAELSKGLMVFIFNLCFGNIRYSELYYGQCEICGSYYCHLDKKVDHPCQNRFLAKGKSATN